MIYCSVCLIPMQWIGVKARFAIAGVNHEPALNHCYRTHCSPFHDLPCVRLRDCPDLSLLSSLLICCAGVEASTVHKSGASALRQRLWEDVLCLGRSLMRGLVSLDTTLAASAWPQQMQRLGSAGLNCHSISLEQNFGLKKKLILANCQLWKRNHSRKDMYQDQGRYTIWTKSILHECKWRLGVLWL